MDLGKTIQKNRLAPAVPVFVFISGLAFCVVIWLMNIYFMVVAEGDGLYCVLSKRYGPLNYVELTTLVFLGFCLMALLLIPARKKIYAVALFVSCFSIACNTLIFRASARLLYVDTIRSAERAMENIVNGGEFYYLEGVMRGIEDRYNYLPRLKRYYSHTAESWREIEDPTFRPVDSAFWNDEEKAKFNGIGYTCWQASQEKSHSILPSTLFFSTDGKAAGILFDGTRLFGFANPEAARTNDFYHDYIVLNMESDEWSFDIRVVKTNGTMHAECDSYWVDETMKYELQRLPEAP